VEIERTIRYYLSDVSLSDVSGDFTRTHIENGTFTLDVLLTFPRMLKMKVTKEEILKIF
jgi:hypothetical protein